MDLLHLQIREEQQLSWEERELELERRLDLYEKRQNEIVETAQKVTLAIAITHRLTEWLALVKYSIPIPHVIW